LDAGRHLGGLIEGDGGRHEALDNRIPKFRDSVAGFAHQQQAGQPDQRVNTAKIVIIAGPKGAGKTTFARAFLPQEAQCPRFINADLIAAGLSPFAPEAAAIKAGRLMLQEIASCVDHRESFAFETTLAGHTYLRRIKEWQALGYHVTLFFLRLASPELAIARVAERVRQGGHNISEAVIRRRFVAGWVNFETQYRTAVNAWAVYDNSGNEPNLIEWGEQA
jgi:predicted ABC-type ATPase